MASKSEDERIKENVVYAARILIKRRICEAFGHVSAWFPETDLFAIIPKSSMDALAGPEELVTVDTKGERVDGKK